jgi:hypothetical protein
MLSFARTIAASSGADAEAHWTVARLALAGADPRGGVEAMRLASAAVRAEVIAALNSAAALGGCFGCAVHAAMANAAELLALTEGDGAAAAREQAAAKLYEAADAAMSAGKFALYGSLQERAASIEGAAADAAVAGLRHWN